MKRPGTDGRTARREAPPAMLSLAAAAGYGGTGGLIMEAVHVWRQLQGWQQARRQAIADGKPRPGIGKFIDPAPDITVAITRALLGAAAGWLLRSEVTGIYAALCVGASAPALLSSLGKATTLYGVQDAPPVGGPPGPGEREEAGPPPAEEARA